MADWNRTLWEVQLLAARLHPETVTTGMALATQADEEGRAAPGGRRLAEISCISPSAVWSNLRGLAEMGWIARDGTGPAGRARWQLLMPATLDDGQWISGPAL